MHSAGYDYEDLYADDLRDTIKFMRDNEMYKDLVMYIDSPESASFFDGMNYEELNVYGVSSSDDAQWGTYCTPDEIVNKKHIKTCMSNLFSAIWIEDIAKKSDQKTLMDQFKRVKERTPKTNVQQWGNLRIADITLFAHDNTLELYHKHVEDQETKDALEKSRIERMNSNNIDGRDAKFNLIYAELLEDPSMKNHLVL
jgi:hypothetical protein